MLLTISYLILIFCLIFIFIEDHKHRLVHVLYYLGLFVSSIVVFVLNEVSISNLYKSFVFLLLNLLILGGYLHLKGEKISKDLSYGGIAIGDLVFLIAIIPLFHFINYAFFYVSGIVFSLFMFFVIQKTKLDNKTTVPLAGYLSVYLLLILITAKTLKISLYKEIVL